MTETARLVLAVDSTDIDRGERSLKKLDSAAAKTERETKNLTRATDQMSGAYRGLRTVLATVGAGLLVRELVQASDTYTELRSQIKLVTDSQEELNAVFAESYELANDTRGSLEGTVQLYTKLARSTEELGLANDELFTITKAVNQSFVVSGASAQEAEGAIRQLAQGMASGTLRGDELNSVMENSPRLAKAIAEGLGVTIGELRQLGADGKITAESITTALLSTAGSIDREFQDMERTVGQSLQQLQNDLLVTFGQTDTSEFVYAIDDLRSIVTDPGFQQSMVSLGTAVATLTGHLASATAETVGFAKWLGEELASISGVAGDDVVRLSDRIKNTSDEIERLEGVLAASGGHSDRLEPLKAELAVLEAQYKSAMEAQARLIGGQANELPPITVSDNAPPPSGGGGDSGGSDAIQKRIDALNLEAQTLGMTATQADLYKLKTEGATQAQLNAAEGFYAQIDAHEALTEQQKAAREESDELQSSLAGVQERYATEQVLLEENLMATRAIILSSHEKNLIDEQEANALMLASAREYYDGVDNLRQQDTNREERAQQIIGSARMAALQQGLALASVLAGENEAAALAILGVQTALSAAMAWQNTLVAATRAQAELGVLGGGPAAAASITAWGKLQVGMILATGLAKGATSGAGGGSPSIGGGGGGYGDGFGMAPAPSAPAPIGADGQAGGVTVQFNGPITANNPEEAAEMIIEAIRDGVENKDIVLVSATSRNGRILAGN